MIRKLSYIILVAAVIVTAGCHGLSLKHNVEKSVEENLPSLIGPADSYSVNASSPTLRMMKGKLDRLEITGKNVKLASGITVAKLYVDIRDLCFDTGNNTIKRVGSTSYAVSLSQSELTRYIAKRYPILPQPNVTLSNHKIGMSIKPGLSVVRIAVQGDADLEIREQHILALNLKKLKVAGMNVPEFARGFIGSKLETIFDTNDLGFDATMKSAVIEHGMLTITGDLDLMKMQEKYQSQKPAASLPN